MRAPVRDLSVSAGDRPVLNRVSLAILPGEVHVLLGPNGGGKTTLLMAVMGMPGYRVTQGRIRLRGEEAIATITRGFLDVDLLGLPPAIAASVEQSLAATPAGSLQPRLARRLTAGRALGYDYSLRRPRPRPTGRRGQRRRGNGMFGEGKPRILVVDDDRLSQRLMQDMLVPLGYAVSVAGDGRTAIEQARRIRPHLVFLDIVMPVMDGFEACERLKQDPVTAHIPVVLVTSLGGRESKMQGLAAGASDFLSKPVDEAELVLRVRNLLQVVEFEAFLQRHNEQLDAQVRERTLQLENAMEALRRSREELKDSYLDTILRLTTVAEYKDGFTAGHIKRVGHYCRHLARELGWSAEAQESIFYASPMHDIGKVAIPTEILQKPEPLSAEEFALAQEHTTAGARILHGSTSALLQLAELIALTHHERHDGSGYPQGLSGDQVPQAGMITNLADQYEALRSVRPYKPALPHGRVVAILTRGDGRTEPSHFHPLVLEAFADTAPTFAAIFDESARDS